MSIYGPTLKLPKIVLPKISIKPSKKTLLKASIIIVIILIILLVMMFLGNFNSHIQATWSNNPIDLRDNESSTKLLINLTNTTDTVQTISLNVTTQSKELIIVCPEKEFGNVEPMNSRQVSCIVRRNPNEKIFSGNYTITINTNLGEAKTILSVKTN